MTPKFSVIVPVYNPIQEYFDACITSCLAQTEEAFEVILVDDGSNQVCRDLCDVYAAKDSRIKVIHQMNQGVSVARNTGIQQAQGEWILFIDADDWIEADTCQKLMTYLRDFGGDMLMFNAAKEYANRRVPIHFEYTENHLYQMSDVQTREKLYRKTMRPQGRAASPMYYCWDKVYKRSFLQDNGLVFPQGLRKSEDKVFVLSCLEKADSLWYINEIFYHYRINEASVCHKFSNSADVDRKQLADILKTIAQRMDAELAQRTGNAHYHQLDGDFYRFIFGIISDVLLLQYYHPDNPADKKTRSAAARGFISAEPFATAIKYCSYRELSAEAKLKKFLLSKGRVSEFCVMVNWYHKLLSKPQK